MDAIAAINTVVGVINTLIKVEPIITQTIKDFTPYATALYSQFTGKELTQAERDILEQRLDEMHNEFQALKRPEGE